MKFWKKALLINFAVVLVLLGSLAVFFATPWGRPVLKTLLLVPEVVPNFPVRPLKYFGLKPKVEEISLKVGDKDIKADLYRPQDNKKHPVMVIMLGILATRQNSDLIKMVNALSRIEYAVLIPNLADFQSGFIWTDSVETLISSVEFLDKQDFVAKNKIGLAGFCVGSSISIVAAENEKIADKVGYIISISPYFDLISLSEAATTRQAQNSQGGFEQWEPAQLTVESVQKGFINYVPSGDERKLLAAHFLEREEIPKDNIEKFSIEAAYVYEFLSNSEQSKMAEIWSKLPESGRELLNRLSPSTKIANLKAKLFVLNDENDTFVPRSEAEKLVKSLPKEKIYFAEVDSFEHVNPKTKLERWSAVKQIFHISRFVYNILAEIQS